jgi:hypothetical protein
MFLQKSRYFTEEELSDIYHDNSKNSCKGDIGFMPFVSLCIQSTGQRCI